MTPEQLADELRQVVDALDAITTGKPTERTLPDVAAVLDDLADEVAKLSNLVQPLAPGRGVCGTCGRR